MRGKSLTARALSRYYLDRGLTSYTWLSDQFSTYGTQVIVSTDRARQAAAHRARRPLVRRGSLPAADRPPAQPGRVRQRPTPSPLGRPTRQRSPPPPRRPDHAGALSHPADQCLHTVDDPVPAGRGRRPPRRRHRRPRRSYRPHQPGLLRTHLTLGHLQLRRRRDPQAHPPPATQATRTPLTAIRGTIPRRFGAVTQATRGRAAPARPARRCSRARCGWRARRPRGPWS